MDPRTSSDADAFLAALAARLAPEDVAFVADLAERTWTDRGSAERTGPSTDRPRTEDLYQAEKLAALGSLLAGVSHELNNPLSIITAQAELLELEAAGTELVQRAGKIRRAAERSGRIVQTFLAMARQKSPDRRALRLHALVDGALEIAGYGLRAHGIVVTREIAPDLPPLMGDADQLTQVVVNLLVNAQHAMQDQPGLRTLTLAGWSDGAAGTVCLRVADSGPGIAPDIRRRIFEPFFTTKPQDVGTGVGLSFSLGIVEAHQGRLEVLDGPGGATFLVTLPASHAAPAPVREPEPPTIVVDRPRTALVVDDEPELAESLADLLGLMGYAVTACEGGAAAKALLLDHDYDLMVSDLRMPDVDGPALFAWLVEARPELVAAVAFSTGDTLSAAAARFLGESDRPFMEKPFTLATVRALVESVESRKGNGG